MKSAQRGDKPETDREISRRLIRIGECGVTAGKDPTDAFRGAGLFAIAATLGEFLEKIQGMLEEDQKAAKGDKE